mmetsp:Transcript_30675/g.40536  ORF Transcript_30675/g.40536 Transcript_30675/m.40536 type:complete len:245 (+) Transcript_30675:87-821(+)
MAFRKAVCLVVTLFSCIFILASAFQQPPQCSIPSRQISSPKIRMSTTEVPPRPYISLKEILGLQPYQDLANNLEQGEISVFIFSTYYCYSCTTLKRKIKKWGGQLSDDVSIHFANIDIEEDKNLDLKNAFDVEQVPFIQIFKGGEGIVDSFTCPSSAFPELQAKIEHHMYNPPTLASVSAEQTPTSQPQTSISSPVSSNEKSIETANSMESSVSAERNDEISVPKSPHKVNRFFKSLFNSPFKF